MNKLLFLQFAMMETVISGFVDAFPRFLRPKKQLFTLLCCLIGFLVGLPQVTKVPLNSIGATRTLTAILLQLHLRSIKKQTINDAYISMEQILVNKNLTFN